MHSRYHEGQLSVERCDPIKGGSIAQQGRQRRQRTNDWQFNKQEPPLGSSDLSPRHRQFGWTGADAQASTRQTATLDELSDEGVKPQVFATVEAVALDQPKTFAPGKQCFERQRCVFGVFGH